MNSSEMTLEQIRIVGNAALLRALGPVGMIRFLQQFETGHGDYSLERHQWLDKMDLDTLLEQIHKRQQITRD
jgi:hypothetical protein